MMKKMIVLASIFMLCLTAACTTQAATASATAQGATALSAVSSSTQLAVKDKLGFGILSLDGTALSITTIQVATLLPLWQAVQALGTNKNAADQEIAAVYTQIQETLTADQLAHIDQLALSQEELTAMLLKYQTTTSQAASTTTKTASSTTSSQGQNMSGGPGGEMPQDGGIMMMSGGTGLGAGAGQNTTGETQQSLILSQATSKNSVEINVLFANAVIHWLEQRVDS